MILQFLKMVAVDFLWIFIPTATWLLFQISFKKWKYIVGEFFSAPVALSETVLESVRFSERMRIQASDLETQLKASSDRFLVECFRLVRDRSLSTNELRGILKVRVRTQYEADKLFWEELQSKVKHPLLMGFLMSLGLMAVCYQNGEAVPWSHVCLFAFWGLSLSQLGLQGIVDRMQLRGTETRKRNTMIAVACRSVSDRVNPYLMTEELNSFLPHPERVDWHQVAKSLKELPYKDGSGFTSLPQGFWGFSSIKILIEPS